MDQANSGQARTVQVRVAPKGAPRFRWLTGLIILAVAWLIVARRAEVRKVISTLVSGQWEWVLLAGFLQVVFYVTYAALYQAAFRTAGIHNRTRDLLPSIFQSLVVNLAAPGTGVAVILATAVRTGGTPAAAAAGAILVRVADFGTFVILLGAALLHLYVRGDLASYEVAAAMVIFTSTAIWAMALVGGLRRPAWLRASLAMVRRFVNAVAARFGRKDVLDADWADRHAGGFQDAAAVSARDPVGLARTLAVAVLAHAVDLVSLYALFLAFHQPVSFGTLYTGFAVGILFWVVSIAPEGIGTSEGMMALVFTQLGVPVERAAVIALAFRGLTFWLPLLIGFAALHRLPFSTPARDQRRTERPSAALEHRRHAWAVRLAAFFAFGMACINLLSAVTPTLGDRLHALAPYLPLMVRQGARLAGVLAGFALLVLAFGLWRRKRTAWMLTIATLVISGVAHLLKGLDYEEALLALVLIIFLLFEQKRFQARSDIPTISQGMKRIALAILFTLAYGMAGFYLLDRHFKVEFGWLDAFRQTLVMFTEFSNPGLEPVTGFGRYFAGSIYLVAALTLGYGFVVLLTPVLLRRNPTAEEQGRARRIVEAYGHSSLARFALLPDKFYYFSPGGTVFAYVVKGSIALVLGDPIGPEPDFAPAVAEFRSFAERNGWEAAFYQTLPDHLEGYRSAGYRTLCIGYEALVEVREFSLEGGKNKGLRNACHRMVRAGYTCELLPPPMSEDTLLALRDVSDEWLATMHGAEKGFSLGWFDDDYIREGPVMAVFDPGRNIVAFANMVPEYQRNESTIDLMRRRPEAPDGTMDFIFANLFLWAKEQGYDTFNLGLSPLAGVGETSADPAVERALHFLYLHLTRFYSFKGMHSFKAKFRPEWSPRYIIYSGLAVLPAVALAVLRADGGDEFLLDAGRSLRRSRRSGRSPKPSLEDPANAKTGD